MKRAWVLWLLATGCGVDRLSSLEEDFFVEQTRVELGRVFLGHPTEIEIPVQSRSRFDLVLDADGQSLRVPLSSPGARVRDLALGGGRVFIAMDDGKIRIHDGVTGASRANVNVLALVQSQLLPGPTAAAFDTSLDSLAMDGTGHAFINARVTSMSGDAAYNRGSFLLRVDPNGALVWSRRAQFFGGLVLDESGHLFTTEYSNTQGTNAKFLSLNPSGTVRFEVAGGDAPMAGANGKLITSYGTIRDGQTGASTATSPLGGWGSFDWLVMRGTTAWSVDIQDCFPTIPTVTKTSTATGSVQFRAVLDPSNEGYAASGPLLTKTDSVLVTVAKYPDYFLTEVTPSGSIGLRCQLSGAQDPHRAVLGEERLFVTESEQVAATPQKPAHQRSMIKAYDVPGRSPALSGWVGPKGGPSRSLRPR